MSDPEEKPSEPAPPPVKKRCVRCAGIALLVGVVLVGIVYLEENVRGKKAWDDCVAMLQSQHESVAWADYIPPEVPADQNFFKAPKMQEWFSAQDVNKLKRRLFFNLSLAGVGSNELTARLTDFNSLFELGKQRTNSAVPMLIAQLILRPSDAAGGLPRTTDESVINIRFDNVSINAVIKALAQQSGVKVDIDPQVAIGRPGTNGQPVPPPNVTFQWTNVTPQAALMAVLCDYNLRWTTDPSNNAILIKQADFSAPSGPDSAGRDFVLRLLSANIGAVAEAAEGFSLAAKPLQQLSPVELSVAPDGIPARFELTHLVPGNMEVRIQPSSNSIGVYVTRLPVAAADYLAWSSRFSTDFDAIAAAAKRPSARMESDYQQLYRIPAGGLIAMRPVIMELSDRAKSFLLLGQQDAALADVTAIHDLIGCLEAKPSHKPMLLQTVVLDVGVTEVYVQIIAFGQRLQAWRAQDLAVLQDQLAGVDLISATWNAVETERAGECHMLETAPRADIAELLEIGRNNTNLLQRIQSPKKFVFSIMPRGWLYQNMARVATLDQGWVDSIDRIQGIIHPSKAIEAWAKINSSFHHASVYSFLAKIMMDNLGKTFVSCARTQALVNEAQVVCALERGRLAHAVYPDTLSKLSPEFIKIPPVDPITGESLKYRLLAPGHFLLYSVGWDEKDDGGTPADAAGNGDWVWGTF